MQVTYNIRVPETSATFTITPSDDPQIRSQVGQLLAVLQQENEHLEVYSSFISRPHMAEVPRLIKWPIQLVCRTPEDAFAVKAMLGARSRSPLEISEPLTGLRERLQQNVQITGKHIYQLHSTGSSIGHVVLDLEPDPLLNEVIFESRVTEETIPAKFLSTIISALREAVFRGGVSGYPLSGFRATLVGGSYYEVDSNKLGYRSATILALWNALRLSDTQTVKVTT